MKPLFYVENVETLHVKELQLPEEKLQCLMTQKEKKTAAFAVSCCAVFIQGTIREIGGDKDELGEGSQTR